MKQDVVVINATNLGAILDGIGVYTLNVIRELSLLGSPIHFIIYVNRTCARHLEGMQFPDRCTLVWVTGALSPDHKFRGHLLRLLYANYLSLKHRTSLIFATSQLEAALFRSNQIITIHDVIPLLFRKFHRKQYYYYRYILSGVLRRAIGIVTPSHHTREMLVRLYPVDPGKVHAIHNGVDERFSPGPVPAPGEREDFILFTGRVVRMKNITGALRAFSLIKDLVPHRLVIAGYIREFNPGYLTRHNIDPARVEFMGHVSCDEMRSLMRRASVMVFPSFYEGFGLPPLEGMASGCPVVVSNVASLPEVCGGAAVYIDPYDEHSIADGISRVLTDEQLRGSLIARGRLRAGLFSWKRSARLHLTLFQSLLGSAYARDPRPGYLALPREAGGLI